MKINQHHPYGPYLIVYLDGKCIDDLRVVEVDPEERYALVRKMVPEESATNIKTYRLEGEITFGLQKSTFAITEWWEVGMAQLKKMYPEITPYITEGIVVN